ncbi:MAG: radical SAM protein, partial [Chloroflexota bacterium]|nr:radical SAM protein [Chloroflexota bacterium]
MPRLLAARPELARRYRAMRAYRGVSQARQYDLTERCNLRCPGCYFFAWEANGSRPSTRTASDWRAYFRQEREGGVLLAHLAGAEPALVPAVLEAAAQTFTECIVYTNGIVPIDRALDVRVHVSLWGGREYHDQAKGAP